MFKIMFNVIISAISIITTGCTGLFLWNWFVVPLGLPTIGLAHAIGIDTLITFWTNHDIQKLFDKSNISEKERLERLFNVILYNLVTLIIGYFIHMVV